MGTYYSPLAMRVFQGSLCSKCFYLMEEDWNGLFYGELMSFLPGEESRGSLHELCSIRRSPSFRSLWQVNSFEVVHIRGILQGEGSEALPGQGRVRSLPLLAGWSWPKSALLTLFQITLFPSVAVDIMSQNHAYRIGRIGRLMLPVDPWHRSSSIFIGAFFMFNFL